MKGLLVLLAFTVVAGSGCASRDLPDAPLLADDAPAELVARARQGDLDAQLELARGYEFGAAWHADARKASRWYRLAAENGSVYAEAALGRLYYLGRGVPQDAGLAELWYARAAEAGQPDALAGLGLLAYDGDLGERDAVEAAKWMILAAERGNAFAERFLRETIEGELDEGALAEARERAARWEPTR